MTRAILSDQLQSTVLTQTIGFSPSCWRIFEVLSQSLDLLAPMSPDPDRIWARGLLHFYQVAQRGLTRRASECCDRPVLQSLGLSPPDLSHSPQ